MRKYKYQSQKSSENNEGVTRWKKSQLVWGNGALAVLSYHFPTHQRDLSFVLSSIFLPSKAREMARASQETGNIFGTCLRALNVRTNNKGSQRPLQNTQKWNNYPTPFTLYSRRLFISFFFFLIIRRYQKANEGYCQREEYMLFIDFLWRQNRTDSERALMRRTSVFVLVVFNGRREVCDWYTYSVRFT